MSTSEEVVPGAHFLEGIERKRTGIHWKSAKQGVDGAQIVRVQHELLVADGERGLQPTCRQDEVGAAQQRGVERGDAC